MKKFFSTLSSTLYGGVRGGLLFLALLTTSSLWAYNYDFEYNEIRYKIISETGLFGTVEVVGSYTNYATHFTIPETFIYDGVHYEVTRIGEGAFNNHKTITDIELPNSITSIGKIAFYNSTLKEITIPNSVTDIEESAFKSCTKLTSATLGNNVMTIGEDAFYNCTGLTSITIPNSVTTIGESAFSGCSLLTSVTFGNSVTSIGEGAFSGCSSLKSITLPNSVTSIGSRAFYGCSLLTSVTIPESVTNMSANPFSGCSAVTSIVWNAKKCTDPFNVYHAVFGDICTQITSFTFGENVEYIPAYLCEGMDNLNTITIPLSVTGIGSKAFRGCSSISSVIWNAKNCTDFNYSDGSPFSLISSITSFTFGDRVEYIPASLCRGMSNLSSITIPNSVEDIGGHAFAGCSGLTSVTIGNSVMTIGWCAFYYCESLTSITIPNSVMTIGAEAFAGCSGLTSVTIPNSVESIGYEAFARCSGLTSVTIGNSVMTIEKETFAGCSGLTSITIPNSVMTIGAEAFAGCSGLTSVTIPNSVESIGDEAFARCSGLTSVTIPNSVESIGDNAFYNCNSLTEISIPKNVKEIGKYMFANCLRLKSVIWDANITYNNYTESPFCNSPIESIVITDNVKYIPEYLCCNIQTLKIITLGKNLTSIGEKAFYNCTGLTQVNYTGDVASWCKVNFTDINDNPNYYAKNLYINGEKVTDVVIPNTIKTINPYTFYGCSELSSLVLPKSVTSIGNYAFGECRKLYDIYCYPTIPPTAEESSFANYNVNLYVPCESLKDYQMDMVFGSFKYIQCLEDLIPSEPQDTTITHTAEMVTICEGEEFTWYGNEYSKSGTYTHTETEETEEYIYHHVYTLELMILPTETIEYVIEAEDSYEWHSVVHTESGTYTYRYECTTEILYLTIKDTPDTPDNPIVDTVITGLQYADAYFMADAEYGDYWVFDLYQDYDAYDYVYPAVYVMVNEAYSKNSLNGTYNVLYTEYYTDAESMISTDDEAEDFVGTLTIKHVKGTNYSFNGSFVVDGITYTYDQIVSVFAYEYSAAEETYYELTLSEIDSPDTPDTPERVLSCEEAVALCLETGATATTEEYTIRGYVTEITTEYLEQYKNISFYMADTKDGGQVLFTYRIKPMYEADIAVKVGDFVEVVGKLVNYNGYLPEVYPGVYTIVNEPELPTGTSDIQLPTSNTKKVVKDGQLFIIHEGKTYNAMGVEM